jgi:hypothetical protein
MPTTTYSGCTTCCGGSSSSSSSASNSSGGCVQICPRSSYTITTTNFTNAECTGCSVFNGTFTVTWAPTAPVCAGCTVGLACIYFDCSGLLGCDNTYNYQLTITKSLGVYTWTATLGTGCTGGGGNTTRTAWTGTSSSCTPPATMTVFAQQNGCRLFAATCVIS